MNKKQLFKFITIIIIIFVNVFFSSCKENVRNINSEIIPKNIFTLNSIDYEKVDSINVYDSFAFAVINRQTQPSNVEFVLNSISELVFFESDTKVEGLPLYGIILESQNDSYIIQYYGSYDFEINDKAYKAYECYDEVIALEELVEGLQKNENGGCSLFYNLEEDVDMIEVRNPNKKTKMYITNDENIDKIIKKFESLFYIKDTDAVDEITEEIVFEMIIYSDGKKLSDIYFCQNNIYRDFCKARVIFPKYDYLIRDFAALIDAIRANQGDEL